MPDLKSMESLRQSFAVEAKEHIESIRYFLDHCDLKQTQRIYRELHNLKGSSKAAGFDDVASLCHRFEDVFAELNTSDEMPGTQILNLLSDAADAIGAVLEGDSTGLKVIEERLVNLAEKEERVSPPSILQSNVIDCAVDFLLEKSQTKVSLAAALENLALIVKDRCSDTGKKVSFEINGDAQIDPRILTFIKASLNHIVGNCVDHGIEPPAERQSAGKTETAAVKLEIAGTGEKVEITICDDGRGVDAEKISQFAAETGLLSKEKLKELSLGEVQTLVFDSNLSTARKDISIASGRGIGLAIAADAVRQLGGSVALSSKPGEGTSITLDFPSVIKNNLDKFSPEFKKKLVVSDLKARVKSTKSQGKVLLVEDTKTQAILLERLLCESGFEVETVKTAEETINWIKNNSADVFLIDVNLPDADGYELIERIESMPECKGLPALIISSNRDDKELARFLGSSACGFVYKQFEGKKMADSLELQLALVSKTQDEDRIELELHSQKIKTTRRKLESIVCAF